MTPRHAAALALVGWYLMVPPPIAKNGLVEDSPSLSAWTRFGSRLYRSEHECEDARTRIGAHPRSGRFVTPEGQEVSISVMPTFAAQLDAIRCVATDDPRLKAK
jgi:hypothetical protein